MGKEGSSPVPRRKIDRRWLACGLCLLVLVLAVLAGAAQQYVNTKRQQHHFQQIVDPVAESLTTRMEAFEHGLRGARGAVISAGPQLDRERFLAYSLSREYNREFPGVRGFGYIQRVPQGEEAAFVQRARLDGMPGFQVHAMSPHQGDRFVILYIEPSAGNQAAIGLDIASEAGRRDTAITAARTGRVAITPPITLVQQEGSVRHGFLLLLPVYAEGAPVGSEEERWSATRGWAYAPLTISAVLEDGVDDKNHPYAIALFDSTEAADVGPFYASEDFDALATSPLSTQHILQIYGHDWRLQARARAGFSNTLGLISPWLTATVIGFLGLLSVALWYLVAVSRERRQTAFLNHAQLKALVSGSAEAIIACDPDGRITLWNAAAERMLGYAAAETVGRPLRNVLVDEDEQPAFPAHAIDAPAGPCRLRCKDGRVIDAVNSVSVIRDADGTAQGLSLFIHDLSEHVRAEEQFRRVVEASPSAILMVDEGGRIQLVNAKAEELFGYTREELLGQSMHRLLPDEVQRHHASYIERYFASSEARPMGAGRDLYGLRRDGTRVPVEIGLNPINMADGRYALAFIIDITERKRHEESIMRLNASLEQQVLERTQQIRTYSSRLGAILEHAGYAIIATDLDGRITLFNPAAEQMLGHAAAEMTERVVSIDQLHDDAELWVRAWHCRRSMTSTSRPPSPRSWPCPRAPAATSPSGPMCEATARACQWR